MSANNPENGDQQQSPENKFTRLREIMLLMGKVHPDRVRVRTEEGASVKTTIEKDTPEYWGVELMKIMSGLRATEQMQDWQPDLRVKIISREHPTIRFVRKLGDAESEISQPVRLPRIPRPFLLALDAYTEGASWEDVEALLGRSATGGQRAQIEAMEDSVSLARTYEDVGDIAKKVHTSFGEGSQRNSLMGFLSRYTEYLLGQKVNKCKDLSSLKVVHDKMINFLESEKGRYFRQVIFMDILDHAALMLGKQLLSRAMTTDEVAKAAAAINMHPFSFADLFMPSFEETKEDVIAKIDLLAKIRSRYSEKGLDNLRSEVEAYQFHSAEMTPQYREQIINFIERKRNVYWPKKPRPHMPVAS